MESLQAQPNTGIKLGLCHNISDLKMPEIRFDLDQTIASVKNSIEKRYGTKPETMELVLQDCNGNNICNMGDNEKLLGFYSPQEGYWIHVLDLDPDSTLKQLEDLALQGVEKYQMSDEDYDKLTNNFRKFRVNLIKNNPQLAGNQAQPQLIDEDHQKDLADKICLGNRCKILESGHRGEVKYIGRVPNLNQGYFVGIQLDEPYGKNNGSYVGVQYFTCPDKYGLFVRPDKIDVGDYPEIDPLDCDSDEI